VRGLAQSRGKSVEAMTALIDRGPYEARDALKAGLVDELLYADQVEERLQPAEKVSPTRYLRGGYGFSLESRPKLALVYAVGEISIGESHSSGLGGAVAGSDTIAAALRQARQDESIQAVLLRVDSPGGSGTASDVIWREVELCRKRKPVIVSFGDVAASGGYYIAMGADVIVSQPGTITGSIGVFGGKFNLRGLYDKIGLRKEILTRGQNAALFTEYRPWSDAEREKVHGMMAAFYEDFLEKAAAGRHQPKDAVHAIAQGRVWSGSDALRIGLVDQLGGLDVALKVAKQRAGIDPARAVTLVVMPERKGFLETLLERQEEGIEAALPADLRSFTRLLRVLDGRPLARLPFDVRVY